MVDSTVFIAIDLKMNPATTNGTTNGAAAAQPMVNGNRPMIKRIKRPAANPFASARQPGKLTRPNGQQATLPQGQRMNPVPQRQQLPVKIDPNSSQVSGFTDPAVGSQHRYTDYKLVVSKKDLLDGLRYHIMQLPSDKKVDIWDPRQLPPPAHLHRRDPRSLPPGTLKDEEQVEIKDGLNEQERLALKDRNEQRKLEKAANLAQIAPTQTARKAHTGKTKTKAVYRREFTEEEKRRIQTNYEEKLPWHLEDFENKHCFVGTNQGPSARRHVAFAYEPAVDSKTGRFRLIPVEKLYEFKPKPRDPTGGVADEAEAEKRSAEAEKRLKTRAHLPEWLERAEIKQEQRQKQEMKRVSTIYTGANIDKSRAGRVDEDVDLDFDDDELFADDEEGDMFQLKDEDEALAEKRIREDNLKANFFEVKEEAEYDEEEQKEKDEEEERKENFRKVRRALEKHEHNYMHATDSEYSSSSDDEEDEKERERLEAEKRNNLEAAQGLLQPGPPSGATTPSRKEKAASALSDREGGNSKRKRPGSPNLSEAGSGTDTSTRKKKKTKHPSSNQPSRPDTPSGTRLKIRGPGAGSDTEAGVSDSGTRRLKSRHPSSANLPSRAASPAQVPPRSGNASPAPGAPTRQAAAAPPTSSTLMDVGQYLDIIRAHKEGISLPALMKVSGTSKDSGPAMAAMVRPYVKLVPFGEPDEKGGRKKVLVLKDDENIPTAKA